MTTIKMKLIAIAIGAMLLSGCQKDVDLEKDADYIAVEKIKADAKMQAEIDRQLAPNYTPPPDMPTTAAEEVGSSRTRVKEQTSACMRQAGLDPDDGNHKVTPSELENILSCMDRNGFKQN